MFDRDDDARLKRIEHTVDLLLSDRLESITSTLVRIEAKLDRLKPTGMTDADVDEVVNKIGDAANTLDTTAKP